MCESRVKALKHTLKHVVDGSTINEKPTVSYVELQVFLAKAANIVNDRPLGIRSLTEDDLVPLTPNQLLLGRTSTAATAYTEEDVECFGPRSKYVEELLDLWWKMWHK